MSTANGVHHQTDQAIDSLYSFWPVPAPAPQPLPEAAFSLTLKGTLDGHEALLTARGMTAAEFRANLAAIRGLLDAPHAKPSRMPQEPTSAMAQIPTCPTHRRAMKASTKRQGHYYCTARTESGAYCTERR